MITEETYLANDCKNCKREFNYLAHKSDTCISCEEGESMSWSELADLTHETQVEKFNWCMCEEQEEFPYDDCPREGEDGK